MSLPEPAQKRALVRSMFDRIAPRYDLMNRLLTGGLDQRWRRRALRAARVGAGDTVLDLACGTGDLTRLARARGARAIGLDFARGMLRHARAQQTLELVQGDAERLPLRASSVDVVTCGFALRNFARLESALDEMARVLRPGGRLVLLEVDRPRARWLRALHSLHFDRVVPLLGGWLSDRAAYRYLPASTVWLPAPAKFRAMLEARGFGGVTRDVLLFGAAQLWLGLRKS